MATDAFGYDETFRKEDIIGKFTTFCYSADKRVSKVLFPNGAVATYDYHEGSVRKTIQEPGGEPHTITWDDKNGLSDAP